MARRFRLGKPSKREAALRRNAAFQFYGMPQRVPVPAARKPRIKFIPAHTNTSPPLEADVKRAVAELLAVHPRVLFAVRQNSGAASYEAKSGRYAPVWFYRIVRSPEHMTIVDFWGFAWPKNDFPNRALPIAFECKRYGWTKPRDDRERKQAAFLAMVRNAGGVGQFVTSAEQVAEALK